MPHPTHRTHRSDSSRSAYSSRSSTSTTQSRLSYKPLHPLKSFSDHTNDPNAPPCVFWLNGYCKRARDCTFRHDSPFAIHLPQPRDTRSEQLCRFIVNGECTIGSSCPYKHQAPVAVPAIPDLLEVPAPQELQDPGFQKPKKQRKKASGASLTPAKPSKIFQRVLRSCITVQFGPGLEVIDISLPGDTVPVTLTNLPDSIRKKELLSILREHGSPLSLEMHRSGKRPLTATATYATRSLATKAMQELDRLWIQSDIIRASVPERPRESGHAALRTTAVRVVWDPPTHTATLGYYNSAYAHNQLGRINGRVFNRQRLVAFYQDEHRPSIVIPDLASFAPADDLKLFARADFVSFSAATYDMADACNGLTALLSTFGPLESFYIHPQNAGDNKIRAVACFSRSDHLEAALNALHGQRQACVASSRVWLHRAFSVKYRIPTAQYAVIKSRIIDLRTDERSFTNVRAVEPSDPKSPNATVLIYVQGDDATCVVQLKSKFEAVLKGELLRDSTGRAIWDASFFDGSAGRLFLNGLHAEGKVYVSCDARERTVSVCGLPDEVEEATRRLLWRYHVYQNDRRVIGLSPRSVQHFARGGLRTLQAVLGKENVSLNFTDRLLVFRCSDELVGTVRRAANHVSHGRPNLAADKTSKKRTGRVCPVCQDNATDVVSLSCGHDYCTSCLQLYLVSALTSETRAFPLRCIATSASGPSTPTNKVPQTCRTPIPVEVIRKLLTPDEEHALLDASFISYVHSHSAEFRFCPTPDCEQIYRATLATSMAAPVVFTCPSCLGTSCTSCHTAHPGLSCAQHRASLAVHHTAPDTVKRCPSGCGALLQKQDGCNHVMCPICKAHMCWRCMQTFPNGGVYDHMARVHGEGVMPGVLPDNFNVFVP